MSYSRNILLKGADRKYYILKFNTPEFCLSEIEKTWYDLATRAGITMMPSRLIEVEGISHFLTERFDRRNGEKVFTQTLAAVNPEAYCYEDLFSTCRQDRNEGVSLQRILRPTSTSWTLSKPAR